MKKVNSEKIKNKENVKLLVKSSMNVQQVNT